MPIFIWLVYMLGFVSDLLFFMGTDTTLECQALQLLFIVWPIIYTIISVSTADICKEKGCGAGFKEYLIRVMRFEDFCANDSQKFQLAKELKFYYLFLNVLKFLL